MPPQFTPASERALRSNQLIPDLDKLSIPDQFTPARDIAFEYMKDFSLAMQFKDNVFEIRNMKSYVLDGSLYGRQILFNLADFKPAKGDRHYACPTLMEGWAKKADDIRATLRAYKAAGVNVDGVWLDWEVEPLRWIGVRYTQGAMARLDRRAEATARPPTGRSLAERIASH